MSGQQINGVCLVGSFEERNENVIEEINDLNANWISVSPEASLDGSTLTLNTIIENRLWTNDLQGYRQIIRQAKTLGKKVLFKPHVVVKNNSKIPGAIHSKLDEKVTWRGDIHPVANKNWIIFEEAYLSFILDMALFAQAEKIEMFCIGTELNSFVKARPNFWKKLIYEVRALYEGEIIYSANWDNYENIPFWGELDFIGVNSYFPISKEKIPSVEKVKNKWNSKKKRLKKLSRKLDMKVIVTEFGYRNVVYSGLEPWTHNKGKTSVVSYEAQNNLLKAFFESLWNQDWIAGGFLWNWNYNPLKERNTDFTVQNKPAIEIVKQFYSKSL